MGNYTIVVHGTGQHHNGQHEADADVLAESFVAELKSKGHLVHHATITHGGHEHLKGTPEYEADLKKDADIPF